jgi:undecaprenyl diphosphate synthase
VEVGNSLYNGVFDMGVKVLSFWAFSTENWERPPKEIKYLFKLLEEIFQRWIVSMVRDNIKILVSGRVEELPVKLQALVNTAVLKTRHNTRGSINLCLNYGGRAEIVDAVKKIVSDGIPAGKISVPLISKYLYTPGLPDVDLIIRTSGEQRLSGYLMWESDYAELVFIKKHFPQLTVEDIKEAIAEYQRRHRRFGA